MNAALLVARLLLGLGIASHGCQKLFGWFGGHGLDGTGGFMESLGFRPGKLFAAFAGLGELCGGLLITAGWLGGVGPALIVLVMLVAILSVHLRNGYFNAENGWELPSVYIAGAIAVDFGAYGMYSIDRMTRPLMLMTSQDRWYMIGAAIVLAVIALLMRRAPAAHRPGTAAT